MKKRILFYSSVSDVNLFKVQQFYVIDISILEKLGFEVKTTNRIFDFVKFWSYDIGFYYFYKYSFFAALIAKLFLKKNYFTGGIDDFVSENEKNRKRQIRFFRLSYLVADRCIIVSNSDLNNIKKIYANKLNKKLVFSFHSIELQNFICSRKDFLNKKDYFTTIVWQGGRGNIIRKGVDKALYVFSELKKYECFKNYTFYILGKCGEGTSFLTDLCKKYGIEDSVVITDEVSEYEKITYLKRSRYYFQLSTYEGFGIAALEALAMKNIVIHSGKGGLQDVVNDGGIKFESVDDIEWLYNKLISFDTECLWIAEKRIQDDFSIEKRKSDFKQIIKS
jgi:glycosyltransferase involved in cell wall biosynthesis